MELLTALVVMVFSLSIQWKALMAALFSVVLVEEVVPRCLGEEKAEQKKEKGKALARVSLDEQGNMMTVVVRVQVVVPVEVQVMVMRKQLEQFVCMHLLIF